MITFTCGAVDASQELNLAALARLLHFRWCCHAEATSTLRHHISRRHLHKLPTRPTMASHADDTGGPSMIVAALPMLHCLAHLYHDRPCLSDMELIANGVSYPVHRVIISMHSCIFASHCRNCLPTAPTQTLEIGSPSGNDSVEATIQFMYTFDYDLPDRLRQDRQAPGAEAVHIHRVQEFHWQMVLVADSWHMQVHFLCFTLKGVADTDAL